MADPKIPDDLNDCIQHLRSSLKMFLNLNNTLISVLIKHPCVANLESGEVEEEVSSTLAPMLQAIGISCNSLINLSEDSGLQTRDCYSICRSVVECAINVCYIIAEGKSTAECALRHTRQKSFRDLKRESCVGNSFIGLKYNQEVNPEHIDGLQEDLDNFTSSKGREKGWTETSVDDRIKKVGSELGASTQELLHWSRFMVYRHASEILHGTHFGACYLLGLTDPRQHEDAQSLADHLGLHNVMVLMAAIASILSLVEAFHCRYNLPSVYDEARNLFKGVRSHPYLQSCMSGENPVP